MRQEPIIYSGLCGNERIRLMAQWECGMDELAVEWLLHTVKDDVLGWHFYCRRRQCLPSGRKTGGENRGRREEKGGKREGGANTVRPGVYSTSENSRSENAVPVSVGRPWRGRRSCAYSLESFRRRRRCSRGSQMKRQSRCDGWAILMAATAERWFLPHKHLRHCLTSSLRFLFHFIEVQPIRLLVSLKHHHDCSWPELSDDEAPLTLKTGIISTQSF